MATTCSSTNQLMCPHANELPREGRDFCGCGCCREYRDQLLKDTEVRLLRQILDTLVRIENRLVAADQDTSRCGHGTTGVCMYCVLQYDLMRPRK